ncbi:hypothetical protein [Amycolatopsis viridis]|uniref:Uncharacterized protein n=1 Tax=Amycolatopsis viridis TaxID=185678 RepID=A0ABX0SXD7_9PSEU|nr:hypothetical protein [Amycolatopsis viridis]NIH81300.1 hypothetical protein [Amycolatopsis viridis]
MPAPGEVNRPTRRCEARVTGGRFAEAGQNEEEQGRQGEQANNPGVLTPEDEAALRVSGGQDLVDQYKQALAGADQNLIDWIIANGGQILVDLFIGGIKACVNSPNLGNCSLGVVDIVSLGLAVLKAYDVGRALWRVVSSIGKFLEEAETFPSILQRGRSIIAEVKVNCFRRHTRCSCDRGCTDRSAQAR